MFSIAWAYGSTSSRTKPGTVVTCQPRRANTPLAVVYHAAGPRPRDAAVRRSAEVRRQP
jgi:hypothetical protein